MAFHCPLRFFSWQKCSLLSILPPTSDSHRLGEKQTAVEDVCPSLLVICPAALGGGSDEERQGVGDREQFWCHKSLKMPFLLGWRDLAWDLCRLLFILCPHRHFCIKRYPSGLRERGVYFCSYHKNRCMEKRVLGLESMRGWGQLGETNQDSLWQGLRVRSQERMEREIWVPIA